MKNLSTEKFSFRELLRFQKECHRKMQTARLLIWIIYTDGTHKLQQDLWLLKVVTNLKLEIFEFREFKFVRASVEPHSTWMIIQNRQLAFWRVTAFNREVRESDWSSGVYSHCITVYTGLYKLEGCHQNEVWNKFWGRIQRGTIQIWHISSILKTRHICQRSKLLLSWVLNWWSKLMV